MEFVAALMERNMFKYLSALPLLLLATEANAAGDMSRAAATEIVIEMGKTDIAHMFFNPKHVELETGKAYKLVFRNIDKEKHEFAAPEFVSKVFTRKVEVLAADGTMIAEVGAVNEVEVAGGGTVEWFIVPIQTGKDIPVECALEGHKEAGMVGTFTIN
jgi:uncharacterized cupredoxin-like copper-binding protein